MVDQRIVELEQRLAAAETALAAASEAQIVLEEEEARLHALLDTIDEGFMEVDVVMSADGRAVDWRYIALNPSFERLTGLPDVTGRLVSEFMPNLEPDWAARYTEVVNTGGTVRFELPAVALDRWFSVRLVRIGGTGSRRVAAFYNDVSERKRAEAARRDADKRQAFLLGLSDALRAEPSADAIANRALRMLFEHMQLNRCYIGIYRLAEDIGDFLHQVHDGCLPPLPAQVRLSDFPEALQVAFDRTLVIDDVVEMEDAQHVVAGLVLRGLIVCSAFPPAVRALDPVGTDPGVRWSITGARRRAAASRICSVDVADHVPRPLAAPSLSRRACIDDTSAAVGFAHKVRCRERRGAARGIGGRDAGGRIE